MRFKLGNSYTCFLCAPGSNCEGTALVFAAKNMAFCICLIDLIGLAVVQHMTIDSFTGLYNACKSVMKGNHGCEMKGFIVNLFALRAFRTIKFPETIAWLLSTEVAIVSNFTLNNLWTFRNEKID